MDTPSTPPPAHNVVVADAVAVEYRIVPGKQRVLEVAVRVVQEGGICMYCAQGPAAGAAMAAAWEGRQRQELGQSNTRCGQRRGTQPGLLTARTKASGEAGQAPARAAAGPAGLLHRRL